MACGGRARTAVEAAERLVAEKGQLQAKLEDLERKAVGPQEAAKALRDIRLHAEQQLSWVLQKMSVSHQKEPKV